MKSLKKIIGAFWVKLCRKWSPILTIKKYIETVEKIYRECWREEERRKITSEEIEKRIFWNKKISLGTKRVYAVQIRAFLKFCKSLDLPVINPEQIAVPKFSLKEAKYLNEEEEKKILEALKWEGLLLRTAISLMLSTGLRVSEACSISKGNLEKAQDICWIFQIPITWKGNKTRGVFLSPKIYEKCMKRGSRHKKTNILWVDTHEVQRIIKVFSQKIGIKFTAHTLRHTFLTKLARKGADLYKIQKIAGHNSIITTSRYLHTHNRELAEVAKLGALEKDP